MTGASDEWADGLRRRLRVIAILAASDQAGISPIATLQLHTVAYLADALAPVWGLQILDAQRLKRHQGPLSPALQHDIDILVGRGVVVPQSVQDVPDGPGAWRLDATYHLNEAFASPILRAAGSFDAQARHLEFVQEVVNAASGLGLAGISRASDSDAAYSDILVDFGGLLDIAESDTHSNRTASVARRFGELRRPGNDTLLR